MNLAILGLGSIGQRHGRNAIDLGHRVFGYDPDAEKRAEFEQAGGEICDSGSVAIENAEAVVIASPNRAHLDDLRLAINNGRHVMAEKPLAHDDIGVEDLLDQASQGGQVIFAALNQRYNPVIAAARRSIIKGDIGKPLWARLIAASYLPDWRPWQDHRLGYAADPATGGVIFDVIHEFDLANHLFGPACTIAACARNTGLLDIESEDCADIVLEHESGLFSSLHIDYITRPKQRRIEVAGDNGFMEIDLVERRMRIQDQDGNITFEKTWSARVDNDYREEMAHFIRCVCGEDEPRCDGREALSVLRQVLAARKMSGLPKA